jgi:hypothetical protein
MMERQILTIGGLSFTVEPPPGLCLLEPDPTYDSFLDPPPERDRLEVGVRFLLGDGPDLASREPSFTTPGAWACYREGADLLFELRPGASRPLWTTRLARPTPAITVHCGEDLLVASPHGQLGLLNPMRYPLDQLLWMCLGKPPGCRSTIEG